MKYKKKPVIIEALQWNKNESEFVETFGKDIYNHLVFTQDEISIETLEGVMNASLGDYIIRGIRGEYYPCKPDIFEQTYEIVNNEGFVY